MICAIANIHIPAVKQLGHTNSASPIQLNTNPVKMRREKAYLQKRKKKKKTSFINIIKAKNCSEMKVIYL